MSLHDRWQLDVTKKLGWQHSLWLDQSLPRFTACAQCFGRINPPECDTDSQPSGALRSTDP
ncbi:hypothetical protein PILCRDRAFT_814154, partial [Piloderma croceum F 1598]